MDTEIRPAGIFRRLWGWLFPPPRSLTEEEARLVRFRERAEKERDEALHLLAQERRSHEETKAALEASARVIVFYESQLNAMSAVAEMQAGIAKRTLGGA